MYKDIGRSTYKIFWRTPPLRDPIISFSHHTFSPKSTSVGGPRPPKMGPRPPTGNLGSALERVDYPS